MAQVKKPKQTQSQQGETKSQKNPLGSNTELQRPGDSYTEKMLNKLGSVLKRNNELGLRDKYTMSEVSKIIIKMYRSRMGYDQKYRKGIRTLMFRRD